MKNLYKIVLSYKVAAGLFVTFLLCSNTIFSQQNIGAYPNIDAGFETQSSGNLGTTQSSTAWTYVSSGSTQSRAITATGGYGGPKFLSVGRGTTASNSSTTVNSNQVTNGTFLPNTKYIVQFHYRQNALFTGNPDTSSFVFISFDGTSSGRRSASINLGTPPPNWTGFSSVVTTDASVQTSTGTCGINIKNQLLPSPVAATIDVDNFVVYPADNQVAPVKDITAPNPVSGLTATGIPAVIDLSWSAPAGGLDGGGYVVIRFTADPTALTEPDPLQNAVYRAASSNTIGTTGTVAYIGSANSFSDGNTTPGTSYWYRVYAVDKAFNYSTAVATGPVTASSKTGFYYDGSGPTDNVNNWWTNNNGTGAHPPNFTNPGQVFRIITNADLVSTLTISGIGSLLIIGAPSPGVPAMTVQFNSANLPAIDTLYQSSDGNPVVLNCNTSNVPSISLLFDIFTELHYRAPGTTVSTSKTYNKIVVENNADVTFTGTPVVQTSFTVESGSTAILGTLSSRWLSVNSGGTATINGKLITPKLTGLFSGNVGVASSTGGAIQFIGAGDVVLGPSSTIEYSGISSTTTQLITPRTDYVNMILSGSGVSKTFTGITTVSGTLTLNTGGATGALLSGGVLTVNGGLVLTNGKINTDATNLLVVGSGANVTTGTNSSYINGPVQINTNAAAAYILPIGKNNLYRPVIITPATAVASVFKAENFNLSYTDVANVTTPLTGVSNVEYWDIARISGSNASVSLSLDGNAVPGVTSASELVVAQYTGSTWVSVNAAAINPGDLSFGVARSSVLGSFGSFTFGIKPASAFVPKDYYIDSITGNDGNPGTLALPIKNISKLNSITIIPGSKILLKCGSSWTGQQLKFKGSGISGSPIVVDKYGTGATPLLNGNGLTGEAVVYLFNQQYIEINNLEISNQPNGPDNSKFFVGLYENGTNPLGADRRGVMVALDNFGTANHIYLKNLNIHHVKGQLGNGANATNGAIPKRTGGIFFTVLGNTEQTSSKSRFNDVLIDSCNINYCENTGLAFDNDWNVYYPGGNEFTDWFNRRYSNIKVSNNVIHHIGKNAMIIRCTDETGLIEKNVCYETALGTTGNTMFTARAKGTVFQYNEGYLNRATTQTVDPGSIDGSMYDPDFGSVGIIFQYSYSHDNSQGLYWGCNTRSATNNTTGIPDPGDTACVARYNVSQNDQGSLVFLNYSSAGNEIYNNVFYIKAGSSPNVIQENSSNNHKYNFYNNIIYNQSNAGSMYSFGTGTGVQNRTIQYNVFFGNHPADEPSDPFKLISDPKFLSPGTAGLGINSVYRYKLKAGSPVLGNGKLIVNNGGLDYFKNILPATAPNRGIYQGAAPVVYTFTGNGNWSVASNWSNNLIPPSVLKDIDQIIIDPVINGECILDVTQTINTGANITVATGKKFRVLANVIMN